MSFKLPRLKQAAKHLTRTIDISTDSMYEKALEELNDNKPHKASWARAFSEAEGDETKAKALYIEIRVVHLKAKRCQEEPERLRKEEERLKAQELCRLREEKKIEFANSKVQLSKVKEVLDLYLKEDYSFKYGEQLYDLVTRKTEIKCLHCGDRLPSEISSFCETSHRKAFFNSIDKYIER